MSSDAANRRARLIVATAVAVLAPAFPGAARAQRIGNFGFEEPSISRAQQPAGWTIGSPGFRASQDTTVAHSGKASLRIDYVSGTGFAATAMPLPTEALRGHRLTIAGWIRTSEVAPGWAGYWLRVDGPNRKQLFLDNMMLHGAAGTTDWTRYQSEVVVDTTATAVWVGPILSGRGSAWYDDLEIQLDGQPFDPAAYVAWKAAPAELAWARKHAIPFATPRAGSGFADLKPLAPLVGDARIVALGEGTHGTSEFFRMKHRLTEYLAVNHGFTVFAIEANMPEARRVNEYVLTGRGDPKAALSGLYFWTWDTQEVLDMIEWMRAYNVSGKGHIEFWGFDMQTPTVAMDSVRAFVARAEPAYLPALDSAWATVRVGWEANRRGQPPAAVLGDWRGAASGVLAHLVGARPALSAGRDSLEVEWAIQNARIVLQAAEELQATGAAAAGRASRDSSMAANVGWILAHQPAGTRIVLWAHNGHVSRNPGAMGAYLGRAFPGQMRVFGFAFDKGSYIAIGARGRTAYPARPAPDGSFESAFRALGQERFILDLRPAATVPDAAWLNASHEFRSIGAMAMDPGYDFYPTQLAAIFDAIIYFGATTPSAQLR